MRVLSGASGEPSSRGGIAVQPTLFYTWMRCPTCTSRVLNDQWIPGPAIKDCVLCPVCGSEVMAAVLMGAQR